MASIGQIIFWSMIVVIILLSAIIIFILVLAFSGSRSSFSTTTQRGDIVANFGEDAILECRFVPDGNFDTTEITWTKEGVSGVVHKYVKVKDELKEQNAQFKRRTSLFLDNISRGNASLKLSEVESKDDGTYTCTVSNTKGKGDTCVILRVGGFHFKIVNRLYWTPSRLGVAGLRDGKDCWFCSAWVGDLHHVLWECRNLIRFWDEVLQFCGRVLDRFIPRDASLVILHHNVFDEQIPSSHFRCLQLPKALSGGQLKPSAEVRGPKVESQTNSHLEGQL
ncbi:V-set domain-containing T-cell activation inhibitor 1 [Latimeria chalumnae]|uniref:V-set domain-containing T-cell activation inhibitor 1 n=1 Tax=Latimeria chalumnae TaxID=7897 RepID=UPI00313E30FF